MPLRWPEIMLLGGPELLQLSETLKGIRPVLGVGGGSPGNRKGPSCRNPTHPIPETGTTAQEQERSSSGGQILGSLGKTRELVRRMLGASSRSAALCPAGSLGCAVQKAAGFYSC